MRAKLTYTRGARTSRGQGLVDVGARVVEESHPG
jgi:hypothetical protein